MSHEENDENKCETKFRKKWLLIKWIGSFTKDAFDIINISDVVFDDVIKESNLKIGSAILVRCGKIKSAASVLQVSENTDTLYNELRRLQRDILKENSINVIQNEVITPKLKKRRLLDENIKMKKPQSKSVQAPDENIINKLMQENQRLKAELYEAHKIINTMCKEMTSIVQGAQKRMITQNSDSYSSEDTDKTPPENIMKRSPHTPSELSIVVPEVEDNDNVLIGTGKTPIPRYIYNQINWLSFTAATRKLLMTVFSRDILATHSLTGKPSPAFIGSEMPIKMKLDPTKVTDIVEIVSTKCGVSESMVRSAITTKCADENKMYKKRASKTVVSKIESTD